jgi:hypothetical protein
MEVQTINIPYTSRSDVFTIYPLADVHGGTKQCNEKLLDRVIAEIKADPLARWFSLGDMADYINFHDKRFDLSGLAPWLVKKVVEPPLTRKQRDAAGFTIAGAQADWLVEKFTPIADKCLGWGEGNHDEAIRLRYENEIAYTVANRIKVRNIGVCSYNRLTFTRVSGEDTRGSTCSVVFYLHHGYFTGRLAGAIALGLQRMFFDNPQVDIIVVGHAHQKMALPFEAKHIEWNGKKPFESKTRWGIMTGPFKRAYSQPGELPTYEESKGYFLSPLGPVRIRIAPDKPVDERIQVY